MGWVQSSSPFWMFERALSSPHAHATSPGMQGASTIACTSNIAVHAAHTRRITTHVQHLQYIDFSSFFFFFCFFSLFFKKKTEKKGHIASHSCVRATSRAHARERERDGKRQHIIIMGCSWKAKSRRRLHPDSASPCSSCPPPSPS